MVTRRGHHSGLARPATRGRSRHAPPVGGEVRMKDVDHRARTARDAGAPGFTSRVVLQNGYGSPDVLHIGRLPRPWPGPGQVLVRVKAASVNARDWHVMRGEPRLARLLDRGTFALRRPRVATRGTDL